MKRRPLQRRTETALQDRACARPQPASARLRVPHPHALGLGRLLRATALYPNTVAVKPPVLS